MHGNDPQADSPAVPSTLTLFYDGDCPICRAEVRWLKRHDRRQRLRYVDVAAVNFHAPPPLPARARLLERIHLLDAGGQVHVGMAVFRLAYRAVGLGWLVAPTGWPLLRPLFDRLYGCFARHRIGLGRRFGRRCDSGSCRLR